MNQNQPSSEVLTVNEIAGYLRVSETTVWRWCNSGKLPAFRIGRSWRIRRTDLEQHIKQSVSEPELASNNACAYQQHQNCLHAEAVPSLSN